MAAWCYVRGGCSRLYALTVTYFPAVVEAQHLEYARIEGLTSLWGLS